MLSYRFKDCLWVDGFQNSENLITNQKVPDYIDF